MTVSISIAAAVATLFVWLSLRIHAASRNRNQARAGYFSAVAPLFDKMVERIEPTGFPRATAHFGAHAFDLQALPDSLTFRKLPALWVMISLPAPLPVKATLDIMTRTTGQEPFSNFASLEHSLLCPDFLPKGTGVRSDDATQVPQEEVIARFAPVFDDNRVKELLISPKGLRVVILAEEAERGRYLIFRDAEMGLIPLDSARVAPIIDALLALRADLILQAKGTE